MICLFNCLIFLAVCLNISIAINIKILTNSNQQTQSYKFTNHIAAFLSVVLITEMLEICIQTSYDQNVQLILKSYLPVVLGTTLNYISLSPFVIVPYVIFFPFVSSLLFSIFQILTRRQIAKTINTVYLTLHFSFLDF